MRSRLRRGLLWELAKIESPFYCDRELSSPTTTTTTTTTPSYYYYNDTTTPP